MSELPRGYKIILRRPEDASHFLRKVLKLQGIFSQDYRTTIGASVYRKEVRVSNNIPVLMVIWDLAEPSHFARVQKSYLVSTEGAILVFNLWDPSTLEPLISLYPEIKKTHPNVKVLVIGRSSPSSDEQPVPTLQNDAKEFAMSIAGRYIELGPNDSYIADQAIELLCQEIIDSVEEVIPK